VLFGITIHPVTPDDNASELWSRGGEIGEVKAMRAKFAEQASTTAGESDVPVLISRGARLTATTLDVVFP